MPVLALLLVALLQPPPADLVIRGGTIVAVDAAMRVLEGATLVVRGDRIDAVLPAGSPVPESRRTIDATGQLVLPGLVNTHGHVPMVLFRGVADDLALMDFLERFIFPLEAKHVDREFVYWGTLLAAIEMARSGTTTFADMYYFEEDAARATDRAGLRAVLGQTLIGFPAPDHKTAAEALEATAAFLEHFAGHARITASVAPHALYTTPLDIIRRSADLARRYHVPLQIHVAESPAEDRTVRAEFGMSSVAVLDEAGVLGPGTLLHHAITLTDDDIGRLARRGSGVSHNVESNMKTAAGIARVPDLLAAGIAVGLGTDGAASNNNLDLFEEMDSAAKLHKLVHNDPTVLPARQIVRMATIEGARALGMADRIGSLEAGKLADIVIVDVRAPELTPLYDVYSHLVYAIKGHHVSTVIVGGRPIVEDRRMVAVDTDEVLAHARAIQDRIRRDRPNVP